MRFLFIFLILLAGCRDNRLLTGDLVFVAVPQTGKDDGIAGAITASTSKDSLNVIHVGIIEVVPEGVMVIDATGERGVAERPLDVFFEDFRLEDGSMPIFYVKRLDDNSGAASYVERAKSFVGEPYDYYFMHGNGAHYCSELVYDSYRRDDGTALFPSCKMNFKAADGSLPVYWVELFDSLGVPVPQGEPGTNPQEMFLSPALDMVCRLPSRH